MLAVIDERRKQERADGCGRRRAPRVRVLLAAVIETEAGERPVRMRNLSSGGALIETDAPLTVGEAVILKRGKTIAPAEVAWASATQAGLRFLRPIRESEVLIHIGKAPPSRS